MLLLLAIVSTREIQVQVPHHLRRVSFDYYLLFTCIMSHSIQLQIERIFIDFFCDIEMRDLSFDNGVRADGEWKLLIKN